jgi:hypothetical protein
MDALLKAYFDLVWNQSLEKTAMPKNYLQQKLSLCPTFMSLGSKLFKPQVDYSLTTCRCQDTIFCVCKGFKKHHFSKEKGHFAPDIFFPASAVISQPDKFRYVSSLEKDLSYPEPRTILLTESALTELRKVRFENKPYIIGEIGPASEWHIKLVQLERDCAAYCFNQLLRSNLSEDDAGNKVVVLYDENHFSCLLNYVTAAVISVPQDLRSVINETLKAKYASFPHLVHLANMDKLFFLTCSPDLPNLLGDLALEGSMRMIELHSLGERNDKKLDGMREEMRSMKEEVKEEMRSLNQNVRNLTSTVDVIRQTLEAQNTSIVARDVPASTSNLNVDEFNQLIRSLGIPYEGYAETLRLRGITGHAFTLLSDDELREEFFISDKYHMKALGKFRS